MAKLEDESKSQAELIKSRDEEIKKLKDSMQDPQKAVVGAAAEGYGETGRAENDAVRKDFESAWWHSTERL